MTNLLHILKPELRPAVQLPEGLEPHGKDQGGNLCRYCLKVEGELKKIKNASKLSDKCVCQHCVQMLEANHMEVSNAG